MKRNKMISIAARHAFALLAACLATGVVASAVQTQLNISVMAAFVVPVAASTRIMMTLEDIARFGLVMIGISAAGLIPALLLVHMLSRKMPAPWRRVLLACAGACGLWLTFLLLGQVTPMPALVNATGETAGLLWVCAAGLVGGLIYGYLRPCGSSADPSHIDEARGTYRPYLAATMLLALVPVISFVAMMPAADAPVRHADPGSYDVQTVVTGLDRPWSVAFLPDGRLIVTQMAGDLSMIGRDGNVSAIGAESLPPIFHDGGVTGLKEVVLDPDFDSNSVLYLSMGYGSATANGIRVVRARLIGGRLDEVRILFSSTLKSSRSNNGGRMAFLPDGTLAITVGDGNGHREQAQNPANHLGKVVRIDPQGGIPANNPFRGQPHVAPELYSMGHRNPQGIAVDPATGTLLLTEHGARGGDEINAIQAGGNYGWPIVTGGIDYSFARVTPFTQMAGFTAPVLTWTPSIAPAGLAVYQGTLFPEWNGDLLVPALKERGLRRVIRDDGRIEDQELMLANRNERIREVKVAPDGSIYVLTDGRDASLLRITPPGIASSLQITKSNNEIE